MYGVSFL